MPRLSSDRRFAHLVDLRAIEALDVLGPTVEILTPPDDGTPCVMRGTIPPGVVVPLHSHPEAETFYMVAGKAEALAETGEGFAWLRLRPGDVFHVPGDARHAFRNRSASAAVMIVVSTGRIARFFREVGRPAVPGASPAVPSADRIREFLATAARYGYWNATPEENARVGLSLPPA